MIHLLHKQKLGEPGSCEKNVTCQTASYSIGRDVFSFVSIAPDGSGNLTHLAIFTQFLK